MTVTLALLFACTTGPDGGGTPTDTGDGGTLGGATGPLAPGETLLPDTMDGARLQAHLEALQAIADDNEGTRLAGLSGYHQSAAWAARLLEDAGYAVTWQEFQHAVFLELSPPVLEVEALHGDESEQVATLQYAPTGDVTATLSAVDLVLPPGATNSSTSGCEPEDFADFPVGHVALLQRGTCTFGDKVENAEAAGAVAVILFNEGQDDRQETVSGTLGEDSAVGIPAIGASFALGEALAAAGTIQVRVAVDTLRQERPVANLLADLPGAGDAERIVVVGAHLDSVAAGPGINDNGSGTAVVLELAIQAAALGFRPAHDLRFALWGAEESGLIGSAEYVARLSEEERALHVANLNLDMVGSPNGARFVYDGDDSADLDGFPAPDGSEEIEALLTDWLDAEGLSWQATAFDGRSDYGPFIWAGVPAGGLFTGAEGTMTDAEAALYGGTADQAFDPCYHQACDTIDNVDADLHLEMARAAAHATEALAMGGVLQPVGAARVAPAGVSPPVADHTGCHPPPQR